MSYAPLPVEGQQTLPTSSTINHNCTTKSNTVHNLTTSKLSYIMEAHDIFPTDTSTWSHQRGHRISACHTGRPSSAEVGPDAVTASCTHTTPLHHIILVHINACLSLVACHASPGAWQGAPAQDHKTCKERWHDRHENAEQSTPEHRRGCRGQAPAPVRERQQQCWRCPRPRPGPLLGPPQALRPSPAPHRRTCGSRRSAAPGRGRPHAESTPPPPRRSSLRCLHQACLLSGCCHRPFCAMPVANVDAKWEDCSGGRLDRACSAARRSTQHTSQSTHLMQHSLGSLARLEPQTQRQRISSHTLTLPCRTHAD